MKKLCICVQPGYNIYIRLNVIYEVEENVTYPNHWLVTMQYPETRNAQAAWVPRVDLIDVPDVLTCIKCQLTHPQSDEDVVPCPDGKHEWVGPEGRVAIGQ